MLRNSKGFSLIEIMLAVAIIGIIAAIAIPSFLGSRAQARYIGDARSNAMIIQMNMESARGMTGAYPPAGTYVWTKGIAPDPNPLPRVTSFSESTKFDFTLRINADGLTYLITVTDPREGDRIILTMNQNGQLL